MESLFTLLCLVAGGYLIFKHAKGVGSRKGFRVGFDRARRRTRRR